jgi:hypothetical protein
VFVSSVDDLWGSLGTPDEGMKEEGGKVESWSGVSGSLAHGVWYGWSVGVVRSYAAASVSAALAIAVWGQALVAGSLPRLFLLLISTRRSIPINATVMESWIDSMRCCRACDLNDSPFDGRLATFHGVVSLL